MSLLADFADFFKVRKTPIDTYYHDGVGKWGFRVTVDGQAFVCVARNTPPKGGETSIMKRVAGRAQTSDALIALRLRDSIYVFDPVTVLAEGKADDVVEQSRQNRDEEWVRIDIDYACTFEEWYDGGAEPVTYGAVDAY